MNQKAGPFERGKTLPSFANAKRTTVVPSSPAHFPPSAENDVWPEAKRVFAKRRTCADVLHNRGFAVSKATAEKSESKTHRVFEREKPLSSFPKRKANSGLSFKSDRFLRSKNRAWLVRTWLGNKNLFPQNGGHAPPFCTIVALR